MTDINNQNNLNNNTEGPESPKVMPAVPEENHLELNALGWAVIIIAAVALIWFFVLGGSFNFQRGISEETLAQRMSIADGNLGETPFANITKAFSLEDFPLPDDESGAKIFSIDIPTEEPEYNLGKLDYLSNDRIADVKATYLSWAERKGYDISERNSSTGGVIILDVLDGEDYVAVVAIFPSGRSDTRVSITFPTLLVEPTPTK